jgi:hypothetical protein
MAGTPRNSPIELTMGDWMRGQEKRTMHEERRPKIGKASDLLGPGFAPTAVHLNDWNSEEARFNGYFYSYGDASNVPEPGVMIWFGHIISSGHHGEQTLWSHGPLPTRILRRYFHVHSNQMPVYGPWTPLVTHHRAAQVTTGTHTVGVVQSTPVTFTPPFPAGAVPIITLTPADAANPHQYSVGHDDATHAGFTLTTYRSTGSAALKVDYYAVLPS